MIKKNLWNKLKTHCKHGHKFTPKNTTIRIKSGEKRYTKSGWYIANDRIQRRCNECHRIEERRRYQLNKEA